MWSCPVQGLTPLAIDCRPFGTWAQNTQEVTIRDSQYPVPQRGGFTNSCSYYPCLRTRGPLVSRRYTPRVGGSNDWSAKKTRRPRTKQLSTRPRVFGPDTRVESDFVLSFGVSLPVVARTLASRCAQRRGVYGRNTRVPRVLGQGSGEQGFVKPPFGGTRRLRIRLRLPVYSVSQSQRDESE